MCIRDRGQVFLNPGRGHPQGKGSADRRHLFQRPVSYTHLLRSSGYTVDWLQQGMPALSALKSEEFAALVLDLNLPDIDGISLLRKLRREGQTLPVLILTARDALDDRVLGLDAGSDDYMVKPFALQEDVYKRQALVGPEHQGWQAASPLVLMAGRPDEQAVPLWRRIPARLPELPAGTAKITYTSGTTCLLYTSTPRYWERCWCRACTP